MNHHEDEVTERQTEICDLYQRISELEGIIEIAIGELRRGL